MAIKPLRGRHRARNLALPFVVTAAAACTVKPVTETPAARQSPTGRPQVKGEAPATHNTAHQAEEGQDVHVISNPPAPVKPAEATDKPAPPMTSNPPPPSALPVAPATGGKVITQQDGSCIWVQSVKCPPKTACNPPPPKAVQCPAPTK